jgi:hypothetical protein
MEKPPRFEVFCKKSPPKFGLFLEPVVLRPRWSTMRFFFEEDFKNIIKKDTPSLALLVSLRDHIHDSREVFFETTVEPR